MKLLFLGAIVAGVLGFSHARSDDDARVVAAYTTRTAVILTTLTTTVPLTCANYFGTNVCQKRRYRRFTNIEKDLTTGDDFDPLLGGSQNAVPDSLDDQEDARLKREIADASRDPRIALTVWSTTSSTFTYTSESTNASTTFSLSYYCTAVGASFPPSCNG
ncbi:uncharacterized protein LOC125028298 [Penaeus chinensis]|uniref:uncharacterized protein LOC125028298 n=1 Tax=Penaeus chinensis TaxID=139456 RepID=UPI001FB5DDA7|nr:uncharacterized protein LOC125028298 [Penaeus chinensis]